MKIKLEDYTPEELMKLLEERIEDIEIEGMGVIDDTPAGKQLLNTIASMLG